jgi:uncharacterized protein
MASRTRLSRRLWFPLGLAAALLICLNGVVYMHARSFLRFRGDAPRTSSPEALDTLGRVGVLLTGVSLPRARNVRSPADLGLAFETAPVQAADGTRLEAWWVPAEGAPRGRALLFHGYGASKDQLLEVAAWWHSRGFEVGLVDFRGAGGSEGNHTTLGWEEALDVAALHDAARRRGPEPVVLYGFSMGGAAVAGAIGRHGVRPEGAVLEACFSSMRGTVATRFSLMGLPATPLADLLVFWGGVSAGFDGASLRPEHDVRDSPVPLLVLHGADDQRAPPADGERLVAAAGDTAELVVLPRTAHQPGLSTRPPEWGRAVGRLAGRATGGRPALDRAR